MTEDELEYSGLHRQLLHHTKDKSGEIFAATNEAYAMTATCLGCTLLAASSFFYLRRTPALAKRQPDLVLWSVVHTCLLMTAVCFNLCFFQDPRWPVYKRHREDIFPLVFWIVGFNNAMANWITVFRCHFIWWDLGTAAALEDMDWRLIIDNQAKQKSFYLKFRDKFGNKMLAAIYCSFWVTFLPIAGAVSLALNNSVPSRWTRFWIGLQTWLPMSHLFGIYCAHPKYNDLFHFRTELSVVSLLTIMYGSTHYMWAFFTQPHPRTVEYAWWLTFPFPFMCLRVMCQTTLVQWLNGLPITPWEAELAHRSKMKGYLYDVMSVNLSTVLSRTGSTEDDGTLTDRHAKLSVNEASSMTGSPRAMTSQISQRARAGTLNASKPMLDLMADDAGLRLICRHLFREFSSENILFLIETEQFINALKQEYQFELGAEQMPISLVFARTTPKSRIVLKSPELSHFEKAILLFEKYLRSNDQITELNISYFIRQSVYAVFGYSREGYAKVGVTDVNQVTFDTNQAAEWLKERLTLEQLLHIFDEARREAFNLVRESWTRMSRSKGYLDWAERNQGDTVTTPRAGSVLSVGSDSGGFSEVGTPRNIL